MAYIQFLGAAGTVTGSKHLINTRDSASGTQGMQVLIDCGLFQGPKEWRERNWQDTPVPAHEIDAVILTHAHLDHCGWIPRLVKGGFHGPIYATQPTIDLCSVILPDSGHLQEEEARFHNKKRSSKHHPALPLYTLQEAEDCLKLFEAVPFATVRRLGPEISFRFAHAGHILGSSMVEVFLELNGVTRKLLFTGDIGRVPLQHGAPGRVVRTGPDEKEDAELLVMESTYGNREHPHDDVRPHLARIINDAVHRGGSIVVPAFAVERTQKFLFLIKELMESNQIPRIPVFADSPMAIKAVEIFMKYAAEFNDEARALVQKYGSPLNWEGFHFAPKQEDSRKINDVRYPCIIVSSSGMVTGGRILHHLMLRLADPRNQVLFIGFQAPGTRGEIIKSGAKSVRIFSQEVPIRAQVAALEQFSDHADTAELLHWLKTFKKPPKNTFLVHGESQASAQLKEAISSTLGWNVNIAHWLEKVRLG
ncbi:MAG TPA: MBL fold metallo-hydrolase [Candidatus Angelobacter sp.]|nr:MBL fold metallo-hydrolase [Candidatus Angelobacter sp.]